MSLLPGGCTLEQLHQALPFPLPMRDLASEMHDLRGRQIVQLRPELRPGVHGAAKLRRHSVTPEPQALRHAESGISSAKAAPRRGTVIPPSEPLTLTLTLTLPLTLALTLTLT